MMSAEALSNTRFSVCCIHIKEYEPDSGHWNSEYHQQFMRSALKNGEKKWLRGGAAVI